MNKAAYSSVLLVSIAGAFVAGSGTMPRGGATAASRTHADGERGAVERISTSAPAGTMTIAPDTQRLIGVRVTTVEQTATTHALRLLGRVAPDEARVYRINAGIEGFIREVSPATTGSQVKKDEKLATFSAPNSIQVVQTYIGVVGTLERARQAGLEGSVEAQMSPLAGANLQQRTSQLLNLGMSPAQIEEIGRTRQVPDAIAIVAPADGFVLARNVSPGLRLDRGAELYRLADLSRVWIMADVFQQDARHVRPGARVKVSVPDQSLTLDGTVAEVLPQFDPASRTLKVRIDVANPGFVLRPDMFVDVSLPVTLPAALTVPVEAVLDSGLAKTVFVERADGNFEAREVQTGWRARDRVEIVKGLSAGERVVTSGTFLLDSETRMRAARADGSAAASPHAGHPHGAVGGGGQGATAEGAAKASGHDAHGAPAPASTEHGAHDHAAPAGEHGAHVGHGR